MNKYKTKVIKFIDTRNDHIKVTKIRKIKRRDL